MAISPLRSKTPAITVYIRLAQYPILADRIRLRMREELFARGVISRADFEQEVKELSIESQQREGIAEPFGHEDSEAWERRLQKVRDFHTDALFANNLGTMMLEQLIEEVVTPQQRRESRAAELSFNPEIAPFELLFRQGERYEALPASEQELIGHHLEEIKVVLIKRMITDHLPLIGIAKRVLTVADLRQIHRRRIGGGKIGGKAAGMVIAWRILQQTAPERGPDISQSVAIPDSYFIGSRVIYNFFLHNKLEPFLNQKYRRVSEARAEYPQIVEAFGQGRFSDAIVDQVSQALLDLGDGPMVVRSSSLLEDSFGFTFAGKYLTVFCPNQGSHEENLAHVLNAVKRVYASALNPDVLFYRRQHGFLDYDERMAIILQPVTGYRHGRYFLPAVAGVGYSQNPFRWDERIRVEDGFLRVVWGLGTRAVNRVGSDYPRLISLSHPTLRPETTPAAVRRYSQRNVDVIDLTENRKKTVPVNQVITPGYPDLALIASRDMGDYLQEIVSTGNLKDSDEFVLTFDSLSRARHFIKLMRTGLMRLERAYETPIDIEFALSPSRNRRRFLLHILQCRPMSWRVREINVAVPTDIAPEDQLFVVKGVLPFAKVKNVRYVVYVSPEAYRRIPDRETRLEVARIIGRLNEQLKDEEFVLMGPGRWGSVNVELGIHVTYADIYNASALIEIAVAEDGRLPELSYGTHFFQDLVESGIHTIPLHVGPDGGQLRQEFFEEATNALATYLPQDAALADCVHVVDIEATRPGYRLHILVNGSEEQGLGFLARSRD